MNTSIAGPTAAQDNWNNNTKATGTSSDTISRDALTGGNNIYRRGVNQSWEWGANNSKDTNNSRDTNNSINDRNVGNTSSRKNSNSSRAGSNRRYLSHIRDSWYIKSSKNNNSSRNASTSRDQYNSWDPSKANGGNNIGHSRARGSRIYYGMLVSTSQVR
jgi:hypothetical protein